MKSVMSPMERVLTTLRCTEPDRVPFFLLLTMHGAKELQVPLPDYLRNPELVAEGQLRLREKFGHDCLVGAPYAAADVAAWGGEVVFRDDGPPNAGEPFIKDVEAIRTLEPPPIEGNPAVAATLRVIELLAQRSRDVPIVGGLVAPFSLPVMQLGFEQYLLLMTGRPDLFERLMAVNEDYCVAVANAQLKAGATAVAFADPVASTTIVAPQVYRDVAGRIAARTVARVRGGVALNVAAGRCLEIIPDMVRTGAVAIHVGPDEDLADLKRAAGGDVALLGNLNGVTMRHWTQTEAEAEVKKALAAGGPGGGFVLADGHGEIPFQVPDEVLFAIAEAARTWGTYPLDWAT